MQLLNANLDDRTLEYKLLPFGEKGRTSLGTVEASRGSVTIPEDPSAVVLNMEHDRTRPVGRATRIEENDDGITATFSVAKTSAGDDLLLEAADRLRSGVSVELEGPVIRAGRLLSGLLKGAGAVVAPAFPSALLTASDAGEDEEDQDTGDESEATADDAQESTDAKENETVETQEMEATAPVTHSGGRTGRLQKATLSEAADLLASAFRGGGDRELLAALADTTQSGAIGNTEVAQYVGELWEGVAPTRKIVPLFNSAALTSYKVTGWRFTAKPEVAAYSGDKAAVASNAVTTEAVEVAVERIAGAWDVDRKYVDFGNSEFWNAFLNAAANDYALKSDSAVFADVLAAATPGIVEVTAPTETPEAVYKIVKGALAVQGATNALPTFALVSAELFEDFLMTPKDQAFEYLSAQVGLSGGTAAGIQVVPENGLDADQVLVGNRSAVTVHELGGSPIRVEAQNIANGGVDTGLFGYYATMVHNSDGLALVGDETA